MCSNARKHLHPLLPKYLYKNYTKCIQKSFKILNLYIVCIQRLYEPKFHMIMNMQEMCIKYTVRILYIQKMYKLCKTYTTTFACFLYINIMYKLYQTYRTVNWVRYATADVWFLYTQNPSILYFSNFRIRYNSIFRSISATL